MTSSVKDYRDLIEWTLAANRLGARTEFQEVDFDKGRQYYLTYIPSEIGATSHEVMNYTANMYDPPAMCLYLGKKVMINKVTGHDVLCDVWKVVLLPPPDGEQIYV